MKLLTFTESGRTRTGAWLDGWIVDLDLAYQASRQAYGRRSGPEPAGARIPNDLLVFLQAGGVCLQAAGEALVYARAGLQPGAQGLQEAGILFAPQGVTIRPPLANPGKIICVGMNYPAPVGVGADSPEYPVLFLKLPSTLVADGEPIRLPRVSQQVAFEGELVVVIGRSGKHILPQEAIAFIAGYTIANDVTASDLERRTSQWATGKLPDTFTPLGPWLVTSDELPAQLDLPIRTRLNGELVQSGSSSAMLFGIPFLVSYISDLTTLQPGDMILTGSPKGLGDQPAQKMYLQPGDVVTVEIEGLGRLSNPVLEE